MWCLRIMLLKAWQILSLIELFFFLPLSISITIADDSITMQILAAALNPTPKGWNSIDYCMWHGVQCDFDAKRVIKIDASYQNLSGNLPSELSTLSSLQCLNLEHNRLSGPIPSLANLSELREVNLGTNNFTSIPQDFFQGLTNLEALTIGTNTNLHPWSLPADLAQCSNLIYFEARKANVEGNITDIFASLSSLEKLLLSGNNLTGTLPKSFANSGIQRLSLDHQIMGLSGTLHMLSSMTRLQRAMLHKNKFTGRIPDLSKCKNLCNLQLQNNKLTGTVPASLESHPRLESISISNNKLQGPMPLFDKRIKVDNKGHNHFCLRIPGAPCDSQVTIMLKIAEALEYPVKLSDSWQGNNACKKWPFVTCNEDNEIITVNLGKQHFYGTVSESFGYLTALRSLYLNDNNLTGSIPDSLTNLKQLEVLDVSNNNLSGTLPDFAPFIRIITRPGNPLLVMDVHKNRTRPLVIAVSVTAVAIFVIFNYMIKKRYKKSREMKDQEKKMLPNNYTTSNFTNKQEACSQKKSIDNHHELHLFKDGNVVISREVLQQVTDNFSQNNVLGKGGFGVVYKGELHDKTKIAVKQMKAKAMSTEGTNEFQAEIEVLTKVRHRHLVDLLGYCIKGNEGFLVYEYMPQGTLAQHLFEWKQRGYPPLKWNQRVSIALDVAHGVQYLHSLAQQSFIHRDLKSSNILLGSDMRAKVGDFGLVKNLPNGKISLETQVKGTFGYLAPEYAATGRVTTKVDVYAFGVILMEMITGRRALDDTRQEEGWMFMHLATWFTGILEKEKTITNAIIDNTLQNEEDTLESISRVAELAVNCTNPEPCHRPNIGHAVSILSLLVDEWKPTGEKKDQEYSVTYQMGSNSQSVETSQTSAPAEFETANESLNLGIPI